MVVPFCPSNVCLQFYPVDTEVVPVPETRVRFWKYFRRREKLPSLIWVDSVTKVYSYAKM